MDVVQVDDVELAEQRPEVPSVPLRGAPGSPEMKPGYLQWAIGDPGFPLGGHPAADDADLESP